jgi:glycosyltransferase involved in cell wall biosynthesis
MREKLPRVMIDARMVGETVSGVGRYVVLIAKGLAEQKRLSFEPVFLCREGFDHRFSGFETVLVRTPYHDFKESLMLPAVLWKNKASLFHSTGTAHVMGAPCPWVVTIHDLVEQHYGNPIEKIYQLSILKLFAEKAKKVLTVSEFSKEELKRYIPKINPEVIPNAIDPVFLKEGALDESLLLKHGLQRNRYLICLSNPKTHKNVGMLVRAFLYAQERYALPRDWKLVLSMDRYHEEPGVVSVGSLTDWEAITLLKGSCALFFPSLYEGFGLPLIEAGVMGVPIIASNIPAHQEILRGTPAREVLWVEPQSLEYCAQAIVQATRGGVIPFSYSTRQSMIQRYSAATFGARMDQCYQDVLTKKL